MAVLVYCATYDRQRNVTVRTFSNLSPRTCGGGQMYRKRSLALRMQCFDLLIAPKSWMFRMFPRINNRFERSTWRWTKMLWKSQFRFDSLWFQLLMPKSCQVEAKHKGRLLQLCSVELSCATITVLWELCCFELIELCYMMRLSEFNLFNCPRFFLKQSHVGQELGVGSSWSSFEQSEQSTLWIFMMLYASLCIFMHLYALVLVYLNLRVHAFSYLGFQFLRASPFWPERLLFSLDFYRLPLCVVLCDHKSSCSEGDMMVTCPCIATHLLFLSSKACLFATQPWFCVTSYDSLGHIGQGLRYHHCHSVASRLCWAPPYPVLYCECFWLVLLSLQTFGCKL